MGLITVGPFFDKKEAEEELEDAKREYKWCYDDGDIEDCGGFWCVWYRIVYRPRLEELPAEPQKTISVIQQTLF